jgi:hypothetical protein
VTTDAYRRFLLIKNGNRKPDLNYGYSDKECWFKATKAPAFIIHKCDDMRTLTLPKLMVAFARVRLVGGAAHNNRRFVRQIE